MKVKSLTESLEKLIENKYVEKEPSNILEAIDNILGKLNEAEMSPEDARDTELLKSARHKIAGKKTNAKNLTPEEQEVLKKYGLDAWGYKGETKMVTPGKTELFHGQPGHGWGRTNSDSFSEPKDSWNGRSVRSSRGGNYDKANFADRARKLDARAGNQPYKDLTAARHTDEVSMRSKYGVDKIRRAKETADYHADAIRNLDAAEAEAKAQAQQKYDNTMERIADQEERQQAVKQKAQDRIDAILAKHRKEVVESLQHFLRTLNEANMSDEDRRDSETIKDITLKLMKRRNAKLSDEEKALLDKYGIINTSGVLRTPGGKVMPRPDHNLRPGRSSELVSRAHQGDNLGKVNLADYARKADEREAKRMEMAAPYWDDHTATKHDEKNIDSRYDGGSTQRQVKVKQTANMVRDYDDMASALDDRKFADRNIKQLQKDRGDALEQKRSDEKRAESRTVSNREYHTDRLKKYTAEKDRMIADKKAQFSKKNESLKESTVGRVERSHLASLTKVDLIKSDDGNPLTLSEVLDNLNKLLSTNNDWVHPKYLANFLNIVDWYVSQMSQAHFRAMKSFCRTAMKMGYDGKVEFVVGAKGTSSGMWAYKQDGSEDNVLYRSFTPSDNYWRVCVNGKWRPSVKSAKDLSIYLQEDNFSESLNETVETDVVRLQRYAEVDPDIYDTHREWITLKVKPLNEFTDGDIRLAMKTSLDGSVRMTDKYDHMIVWQQLSDSREWAMQHQDLYTMAAIKAHCGINESLNEASLTEKTSRRLKGSQKDFEIPGYEAEILDYCETNVDGVEEWVVEYSKDGVKFCKVIIAPDGPPVRVMVHEYPYRDLDFYNTFRQFASNIDHIANKCLSAIEHFDESLNEAAGNVRIVETGLSGAFGKEIIDSIIGQMSDGIWENTPYMEYYWPKC